MKKIAVIGTGKTGGAVLNLLGDRGIAFNSENKPTIQKLKETAVAIVFVPGSAAKEVQELLLEAAIPAVWGTTGYEWPSNLPDRVKDAGTKWVIGSNFSLGMNLVRKAIDVLGKGSAMLEDPEFHIHEVHHKHKQDAPSGTALTWKEWLNRDAVISSDRQGDVKGLHELHIKTKNESVYLKHEAHSRDVFAEGAIWTADYLLENPFIEPGLYQFSSIFNQAYNKNQ